MVKWEGRCVFEQMDEYLIRKGYTWNRASAQKSTFAYIIPNLIVRDNYEEKEGIFFLIISYWQKESSKFF